MSMDRRTWLRGAAAGAVATLVGGCARDAVGPRSEVAYASAFSMPKSVDEAFWLEFEARIEKALPNFDIRLLIRGETGPEEQAFAGVRRGRLQIVGGSFAGVASLVPEIALLSVPFLFDTEDEVDYVMDKYMLEPFRDLFAAKGLDLLHWTDVGWVNLYDKQPFRVPEAARGRRLRSSTSIASQAFIRELGADTITMPFTDVVPSLQTGLIEGGVTSATMYSLSGISTEAPHYILTRHSYDMGVLAASSEWMRDLGAEERAVIAIGFGGAAQARATARASVRRTMESLPGQGVRLYVLSDEERERWRVASWPAHEKLVEQIGGDARRIYETLLSGKAAFDARVAAGAAAT